MANWGNCDFKELIALRDKMAQGAEIEEFCQSCAKELAARLLAKAIKNTPVRASENCPPGVTGGTLRRGWTGGQENMSEKENVIGVSGKKGYVSNLTITHTGGYYTIEITNPIEYAPYVEFGHRTRGGKGFVKGKFMMTMAEKEVNAAAPRILQKKLERYLKGVFM